MSAEAIDSLYAVTRWLAIGYLSSMAMVVALLVIKRKG